MGASVQIVEDNSLQTTKDGYVIGLRLNWYRSLPVSCIEKVALTLDGQPVEPAALRLEVNGKQFSIDAMEDAVEEFWFVQDTAWLRVLQPGRVSAGEAHTVEAEVALRFPYIMIGQGKFLTIPTQCTANQVARAAAREG